ncbi:MAG TPA: Rrf2 family transcriptional regulator [Thermoanaerobaculia bacterium]
MPQSRGLRRWVPPSELLQSPLYSRSCQDALKIMERLAAAARRRRAIPTDISKLAAETGLSAPEVAQVLYFLQRSGLLKASSWHRSIELARSPEKISMLEVVRAIDGSGVWTRCLLGLPECSDEAPCPAHSVWKQARKVLQQQLQNQTIADLSRVIVERKRRRRPAPSSKSAIHRRGSARR